ncbi:MAG: sporulation protein [Candidatus Sericytochromatia bacterium]|nr:sporulation protein [Candidatus Sericytochromatia bacterium]
MGRKSKATSNRLLLLIGVPFLLIGAIGTGSALRDLFAGGQELSRTLFSCGVAALFGGVGFGLVRGARPGIKSTATQGSPRRSGKVGRSAEKTRNAVAAGPIRADLAVDVGAAWLIPIVGAFILLSFAGGNLRTLLRAVAAGEPAAIIGVGLLLLLCVPAVCRSLMAARFGPATLDLQGTQLVPGELLQGTVIIGRAMAPTGPATVRVLALQRVQTTSHDVLTTDTTTVMELSGQVPVAGIIRTAQQTRIPFSVVIPTDAPVTVDRGRLEWELVVHVPVTGIDFEQDFPISHQGLDA